MSVPSGGAWDELMTLVDHVAAGRAHLPSPDTLEDLVARGQAERTIDTELHPADTARWIVGLLAGHGHLRHHLTTGADASRDADDLRLILTRWLHPARPR